MLGFSILMYGMDHMSSALSPLTGSAAFQSMITLFSNPFVGLLLGFALAAVTQSSSASVGILQAVSAAAVVAIVAAAGAIGMAVAISKCASGMARQPEAAGKINSAMMLGLVFIETAIIYALIVAILIIFVL